MGRWFGSLSQETSESLYAEIGEFLKT